MVKFNSIIALFWCESHKLSHILPIACVAFETYSETKNYYNLSTLRYNLYSNKIQKLHTLLGIISKYCDSAFKESSLQQYNHLWIREDGAKYQVSYPEIMKPEG